MKNLSPEELHRYVLLCNRCGTCQDVCPTYQATGMETDVARSRIRLARLVLEGKYRWEEDEELIDAMKSCLLCKACASDCPSGVPTDQIMVQARNEINKVMGMPPFNKLAYRGVFSHPSRVALLGKLTRLYRRSFASSLVKKSGILNLLKDYGKAEELLPRSGDRNLLDDLEQLLVPIDKPRFKIVYFTGCAINIFYSRFGSASIDVLQKSDIQVHVPRVSCCGGPHLSGGDFAEAGRLAVKSIDAVMALEPDAVITDCATCSGVLKGYGELLAGDDGNREKAERFSASVKDISEFLVEKGCRPETAAMEATATFHDPCHLNRGQGIVTPPRKLLQQISGLRLIDMEGADMCCGGAGSYGALNPNMSRTILDRKMEHFAATGADYLVTSCPACAMQLEYGLRRHNLSGEVVHPVELLSRATSARTTL